MGAKLRSHQLEVLGHSDFNAQSLKLVHQDIDPQDIRDHEGWQAQILVNGQRLTPEQCKVWRISPFGIDLRINKEFICLFTDLPVDLQLQIMEQGGSRTLDFVGLKVSVSSANDHEFLIGLRFCTTPESGSVGTQKRLNQRWVSNELFVPSAVSANIVDFNDYMFFRVLDLSATGFKLETSLRNHTLVPQMQLDMTVTFPAVGSSLVRCKIKWVKTVEVDQTQNSQSRTCLHLGAQFVQPSSEFLTLVAQYLFQFSNNACPDELKKEGFLLSSVVRGLSFKYVKSHEDFLEVLDLRRRSYQWALRRKSETQTEVPLEALSDEFDARSRILMACHHGKCVGSLRMVFPKLGEKIEQELYVKLPHDFPSNDQIVELTRICIDSAYRHSDLLIELIRRATLTIVQAERVWLVGCSEERMLGAYKNMGAYLPGIKYQRQDGPLTLNLEVILLDIVKSLKGIGSNPFVENLISPEVIQYAVQKHLTTLDFMTSFRFMIFRRLKGFFIFCRYVRNLYLRVLDHWKEKA